jgi:DNA-binding MarR family transcriptional regulator
VRTAPAALDFKWSLMSTTGHPTRDALPDHEVHACARGAPPLPDERSRAWVGFLAAHAEITRALDTGLASNFDLSLSALEVLARIAWEAEGRLRMSDLAERAMLSQSRVSRIVDQLEARSLVERISCPSDSRGVYAAITNAGRSLTDQALQWHWARVNERFFAPLSGEQVEELGSIWQAILGRPLEPRDTATCP